MIEQTNSKVNFWNNLLLVALFFQVSAWSYEAFYNTSPLNSVLFLMLDASDTFASYFDKISAVVLMAAFMIFVVTRKAWLLLLPLAYSIAIPVSTILLHSSFAYEYALMANALRIGLPLVLYLYYSGNKEWSFEKRFIIRFAIMLTFVGHGIEALKEHPKFIDFLIEGFAILFGAELTEARAIQLLAFIGAMDIVLGISGLLKPRVWVYSWLGIWGFVTALCRLMYFQWDGIFPMLLRSSHWALPVFAAWMILEKKRITKPWKVWKIAKG